MADDDYKLQLKIVGMHYDLANKAAVVTISDWDKPGGGAPTIHIDRIPADSADEAVVKAALKGLLEQAIAIL